MEEKKQLTFLNDVGLQIEEYFFLRQVEKVTEKNETYFLYYLCAHLSIFRISVNVYQQVVYFSEGNSVWVKGAANMSDVSDLMLFYAG